MLQIEAVYQEYFDLVYKYLICITKNRDIAEELTQETFYIAINRIHTFREDCKLSVWLCQIAKYQWYHYLKKKKKLENIENIEDYTTSCSNEITIDEYLIEKENRSKIYKIIEQLNEETKTVILLRIENNFTFKEIGQILNHTENWARITFYRGKVKLREAIHYEEKEGM